VIDWVSHAISAAIAAVVGAFVGRSVSRPDAKIDKLDRDVTQLRDERIVRVEGRLDRVEDNGCAVGRQVLAKLEHATGMLTKLDLKMDRIAETTAKQAAEIAANNKYVGNLDKSLQRHKETAHHG
jgi:HAMP domain-containing protein